MRKMLIPILVAGCFSLSAQVTVVVDPQKEYQTIQGFGAFGGIKPYWESPPFYTAPFLDYFLNDLGSTIVRTNIFWDLEPVNDNNSASDLDLSKFNYKQGSNLGRQLPYYRALRDAGVEKLIATSWTPPDWMKLHDDEDRIPEQCYNCNNCPIGDDRRKVCGGRLDPRFYNEYAEYLLAYVKILKQEANIDLYAISIQNEPWFANPFESNVVKPEEYGVLLNIVGERFRNAGLTTRIFGPEHMAEWSWGVQKDYVANIFEGGDGNRFLDVYAVHGYVDGVAPDFGSAEGWTALKTNISDAYGKPLWMTETSGYAQTFEGAMQLARSMYLALRFGEISAWVYWSISGEPGSEFSLMANGEPTILYYVSRQFFRYIRPGARRVECTSTNADILPLAFQNPSEGSMTLVLINNGDAAQEIQLAMPSSPDSFTAYRTSATENGTETGSVTNVVSLPARSVTTLVGYGPAGPSIDEIRDYYVNAGDDSTLEIPLTGIDPGAGSALQLEVTSSDETVVPLPEVVYEYPSTEGTLIVHPNTAQPGNASITITLDNGADISGFGFSSTKISFKLGVVDPVTAIKKKVNSELSVYPNPIQAHVLNVDFSEVARPLSFVVKDIHGKIIFKLANVDESDRNVQLNTSGWPTGVYFIEVRCAGGKIVDKVINR